MTERNQLDKFNITYKDVDTKGTGSAFTNIMQRANQAFYSGRTKPLKFRRKQLKSLLKMYNEKYNDLIEALAKDLRRHRQESILLEIEFAKNDLKNLLYNLRKWMRPSKPSKSFVNIFDGVYIYNEPYGVVLVLGTWNYPLQLTLVPTAAAIAGGNCVIIKPSEISSAVTQFIAENIPKYLDQDCYHVVCCKVEEISILLKERFDYIFFTGSTTIGRVVHSAANQHLTPVTLELGGKSPVYLDNTANITMSARRILWGKCINAGQTCIAPDYLLCTKEVENNFLKAAKRILKEWYGENSANSPDLCRIINDRHFQRLSSFLKNGKIAIGGQVNATDRFIEPTVIVDVSPKDPIMLEEIFGPILPIVTIENAFEAVKFINNREKPLALYVFSRKKNIIKLFLEHTSSGAVTVNDTIMHIAVESLPFGGVGYSGMGCYHGEAGFTTFVHKKSCLVKYFNPIAECVQSSRYSPYSNMKVNFVSFMTQRRRGIPMKYLPHVIILFVGIVIGIYIQMYLM